MRSDKTACCRSLTLLVTAAICAACGPAAVKPTDSRTPIEGTTQPASYAKLSAFAAQDVRRGHLVTDPEVLRLSFRRGDTTRPFMEIPRRAVESACWRPIVPEREPGVRHVHESTWWVFYNADEAVAIELGVRGVDAVFWDSVRDCPVRLPLFAPSAFDETIPGEYYKADDVQLAYLWNYAYHDYLTNSRRFELDGDRFAELVPEVAGEEQLLVDKNLVSIVAADGTALLREVFHVAPEWPCYNAQLSVFRSATHLTYATISFEAFGETDQCDSTSAMSRYGSVIAEWDADKRQFMRRFSLVDEVKQPTPSSDETHLRVERVVPVQGGELIIHATRHASRSERDKAFCRDRDAGTGVCLVAETCFQWSSDEERNATWTFRSEAGVEIPMGTARRGTFESIDDCKPPTP